MARTTTSSRGKLRIAAKGSLQCSTRKDLFQAKNSTTGSPGSSVGGDRQRSLNSLRQQVLRAATEKDHRTRLPSRNIASLKEKFRAKKNKDESKESSRQTPRRIHSFSPMRQSRKSSLQLGDRGLSLNTMPRFEMASQPRDNRVRSLNLSSVSSLPSLHIKRTTLTLSRSARSEPSLHENLSRDDKAKSSTELRSERRALARKRQYSPRLQKKIFEKHRQNAKPYKDHYDQSGQLRPGVDWRDFRVGRSEEMHAGLALLEYFSQKSSVTNDLSAHECIKLGDRFVQMADRLYDHACVFPPKEVRALLHKAIDAWNLAQMLMKNQDNGETSDNAQLYHKMADLQFYIAVKYRDDLEPNLKLAKIAYDQATGFQRVAEILEKKQVPTKWAYRVGGVDAFLNTQRGSVDTLVDILVAVPEHTPSKRTALANVIPNSVNRIIARLSPKSKKSRQDELSAPVSKAYQISTFLIALDRFSVSANEAVRYLGIKQSDVVQHSQFKHVRQALAEGLFPKSDGELKVLVEQVSSGWFAVVETVFMDFKEKKTFITSPSRSYGHTFETPQEQKQFYHQITQVFGLLSVFKETVLALAWQKGLRQSHGNFMAPALSICEPLDDQHETPFSNRILQSLFDELNEASENNAGTYQAIFSDVIGKKVAEFYGGRDTVQTQYGQISMRSIIDIINQKVKHFCPEIGQDFLRCSLDDFDSFSRQVGFVMGDLDNYINMGIRDHMEELYHDTVRLVMSVVATKSVCVDPASSDVSDSVAHCTQFSNILQSESTEQPDTLGKPTLLDDSFPSVSSESSEPFYSSGDSSIGIDR